MCIESQQEFDGLREAGRLAWQVRSAMSAAVAPGVAVQELEDLGAGLIRAAGAESAPRSDYGAPCWTFISVNHAVVHGLPSPLKIASGDLVKIDITVRLAGFIGDTACTVIAGRGSPVGVGLSRACQEALTAGLEQLGARCRVRDIGRAVENSVQASGFRVLRALCGHATGRQIHEEPSIPNFDNNDCSRLPVGLVLAVEPMISAGSGEVVEAADGWTIATSDDSLAAHFEETVLVREHGYTILTAA